MGRAVQCLERFSSARVCDLAWRRWEDGGKSCLMTVAVVQTRESTGPKQGHGCEESEGNTGL